MRVVVLSLLLAASPVLAQQAPVELPGKLDVARVTAGTYVVDSAHTQVLFTVNHMGFTLYTGEFTQPTGTLVLDPKNPAAARVEVSFPIDKVVTTVPHLHDHLQTPDFFDSAKYPEGKFVSTSVAVEGTTATIAGNLTLKGVTKPVTLKARFIGAGANPMDKKTNIGFAAVTRIKRSDFGINYAIPLVSDEVALKINAAFVAQ